MMYTDFEAIFETKEDSMESDPYVSYTKEVN